MAEQWSSQLLEFIGDEVAVTDDPLTAETDLLLTGTVDRLGVIRITQWLEERTGVPVPPGDVTVENFQSVAAIATYADRSLIISES